MAAVAVAGVAGLRELLRSVLVAMKVSDETVQLVVERPADVIENDAAPARRLSDDFEGAVE